VPTDQPPGVDDPPTDQLDVHLDIGGMPTRIGQAWFTQRRQQAVTTVFAYTPSYLSTPGAWAIDPDLPLLSGNQYIEGLPGAFQDCSPDRWGRNLVNKRRRAADRSGRLRELNEVDYLIGVSDRTRQGALRFTRPGDPGFLHPDNTVPRLIDLPSLLAASDSLRTDNDELAAVKALLEAGSGSLGGARPKASVVDADGRLMIAKFPHQDDEWDVMAWECVALDLATHAGIHTPPHDLIEVSKGRRVLLTQRFDRSGEHRIGYMSAMTALSATDGEAHDYLEIAEHITDVSAGATADLAELYRRVAFGIAIHNTDDHLRNTGFLAAPGGWRMSPLFDVNPNPVANAGRVTSIAGATHRPDESAALAELAQACRLSKRKATSITTEVDTAVAGWRDRAQARGVHPNEIELFRKVLSTGLGFV
jgi:serine/threonine-protein kinase HipA